MSFCGPLGKGKWKKPLPFDSLAFPLLRKVFPQIMAQDLIKVQPMLSPSAMTFYMDYQYGTSSLSTGSYDPNQYQCTVGSGAMEQCLKHS